MIMTLTLNHDLHITKNCILYLRTEMQFIGQSIEKSEPEENA